MSRAVLDHQDRAHPTDGGKVRFMVRSGGYVMCRRPRAMPYVVTEKEWRALPVFDQASYDEYRAAVDASFRSFNEAKTIDAILAGETET